ncbi:hypothetical protein KCF3NO3_44350 [Chryseobacterium sp. KCF3-3]
MAKKELISENYYAGLHLNPIIHYIGYLNLQTAIQSVMDMYEKININLFRLKKNEII